MKKKPKPAAKPEPPQVPIGKWYGVPCPTCGGAGVLRFERTSPFKDMICWHCHGHMAVAVFLPELISPRNPFINYPDNETVKYRFTIPEPKK